MSKATTVEKNNRFYTKENGEIITENEQLKEWLVIANNHNEELQKERDMYKISFETMSENYFKLENIIKEVRKYITSYINQFNGVYPIADMRYLDLNKILEILDKEK